MIDDGEHPKTAPPPPGGEDNEPLFKTEEINNLPAVILPRAKRTYTKSVSLKNGKFDEDKLFLFVKRESLPAAEIPRFLKLCDTYLISLGVDSLSDIDVEEVALYYRDRIYADKIYQLFASSETTDANLIGQIDKLNKAIEQKKLNLGSRFIDKGKKRADTSGESMMDLFASYQDKKVDIEALAKKKKEDIADNKSTNFTKTEDYMSEKLSNSGFKSKKEED